MGEFEAFRKQWTAYLDVERKVSKIIDFDRDAKKSRDTGEAQITDSMLAAYRVYGKGVPVATVAADTKLEEKQLNAWANYLKDGKRPELREVARCD